MPMIVILFTLLPPLPGLFISYTQHVARFCFSRCPARACPVPFFTTLAPLSTDTQCLRSCVPVRTPLHSCRVAGPEGSIDFNLEIEFELESNRCTLFFFFLRGGIFFFVFSALFYTFAVGGWASFIRILVYGTIDLIFFFFFIGFG